MLINRTDPITSMIPIITLGGYLSLNTKALATKFATTPKMVLRKYKVPSSVTDRGMMSNKRETNSVNRASIIHRLNKKSIKKIPLSLIPPYTKENIPAHITKKYTIISVESDRSSNLFIEIALNEIVAYLNKIKPIVPKTELDIIVNQNITVDTSCFESILIIPNRASANHALIVYYISGTACFLNYDLI